MGCRFSKNRVGPAPEENTSGSSRPRRWSARARLPGFLRRKTTQTVQTPPPPANPTTTGTDVDDGRKSSCGVSFTVSAEELKTECLLPPRRLQPLNHPHLSFEELQRKQRLADAKREEALRKKRAKAHRNSARAESVAQIRNMDRPASATPKFEAQMKAAEKLRETKQREIIERQKQREERAKHVRQQKEEPLNENRLTAFVSLENKGSKELSIQQKLDKKIQIVDKLAKRTTEMSNIAVVKVQQVPQKIEVRPRTAQSFQEKPSKGETTAAQGSKSLKRVEPNTDLLTSVETPVKAAEKSAENAAENPAEKLAEESADEVPPVAPETPCLKARFPEPILVKEYDERELKINLQEAQIRALKNRHAHRREIIMRQKYREYKAKGVRRKARALKEEEELDLPEIETYDSDDDNDEPFAWAPARFVKEAPEYDAFFDD